MRRHAVKASESKCKRKSRKFLRLIYLPRIVREANMKRLQDHIGTALFDTGYIDKDIVGQELAGVECARSDGRRHSIHRSLARTG